jgi:hypothetical protein
MPNALMTRADFFTSIFFFIIGIYMAYEGLLMPGAGQVIEPGGEPGRVPVMVGSIIAFFATILLIRSIGRGGHRPVVGEAGGSDRRLGILRCTVTAIGCSFYAIGLVGSSWFGWRMPYHYATALFLFVFIAGFEWEFALESGARRWHWLVEKTPGLARSLASLFGFLPKSQAPYYWLLVTALIQAILITWAVTYLFERQFFVTLP